MGGRAVSEPYYSQRARSVCVSERFLGAMHLYALRVLATATCLSVWVGGWLSVTAGIVSKRLNLS